MGGFAVAVAVLLATILVANLPVLLGRAAGLWDADRQFVAYHALLADAARSAAWVLWDPWTDGGLPIFADPQVGTLSPLRLSLGLVFGPSTHGYLLSWLFVWCLGGVGLIALARHLGSPPGAALAIALGFSFGGVFTGNAEHFSWIVSVALLPWIVWRLDVALLDGRILPACEAGALWGLSAISGYPGLTILSAGFVGLWAGARVLERPSIAMVRRGSASLALFVVVGMPVFLPVARGLLHESAGVHERARAVAREAALANSLSPVNLTTLASPVQTRLKRFAPAEVSPGTDISMMSVYVGPVILALAIVSLAWRGPSRFAPLIAIVAALALAASLGRTLPVRGWLYDLLPPTRFFRHAAIFRVYFMFGLVVLASLGAREMSERRTDATFFRWLAAAALASALVATATTAVVLGSSPAARAPSIVHAAGWLHAAAAWGGLSIIAGWWALRWRTTAGSFSLLLALVAIADAAITAPITRHTTYGVDDRSRERWSALDRSHSSLLDLSGVGWIRKERACRDPSCEVLTSDQLIDRIPVFFSNSTADHALHHATAAHPVLLAAATGAERTWFSPHAVEVPPIASAFDAFAQRAKVVGAPPLVLHSRTAMLAGAASRTANDDAKADVAAISAAMPMTPLGARLISYRPEELSFEVEAPARGWLLVTDRWARSWEAEVDGRSVEVKGANFLFRAIEVDAGPHEVRFRYQPRYLRAMIAVAWAILAVVATISVWAVCGVRPAAPEPPG